MSAGLITVPDLPESAESIIGASASCVGLAVAVCAQSLHGAAQGARPEAEVDAARHAIQLLGGELQAVEPVASRGPDGPRTVVVVRKARPTPPQYPRREGRPAKAPL